MNRIKKVSVQRMYAHFLGNKVGKIAENENIKLKILVKFNIFIIKY